MQGDVRATLFWISWVLAGGMLLPAAGCGGGAEPRLGLYQRLQSGDHDVLVAAIVEAGRRQDPCAVPYLVELLENDGADVRMFSIESLRKITGRDFAFRPFDDDLTRRSAIKEWRKWLADRPPAGGEQGGGG